MGVDYYSCNYCDGIFSDCGHYITYKTCGTRWCSNECAEEDGWVDEHCNKYPVLDDRDLMEFYRKKHCEYKNCCDCEHYNPASCKYCREEDYTNYVLLDKALDLLAMTREELVGIVRKRKKVREKMMSKSEKFQRVIKNTNNLTEFIELSTKQFADTYNTFAAWQTVCVNLLDMRDAYPV